MPLFVLKKSASEDWKLTFIAEPDEDVRVVETPGRDTSRVYLLRCGGYDMYSDVYITKNEVSAEECDGFEPDEKSLLHIKRLSDELPYDIKVRRGDEEAETFRFVHLVYTDVDEDGMDNN